MLTRVCCQFWQCMQLAAHCALAKFNCMPAKFGSFMKKKSNVQAIFVL